MEHPTDSLLPCPFCLGNCRLHRSGSKHSSHWFNVYCMKCGVQGYQYQSDIDAIKAWNARPQSQPDIAEKLAVALQVILDQCNDGDGFTEQAAHSAAESLDEYAATKQNDKGE